MFRTPYVHHQEDYIVHITLYAMIHMHLLCKQSTGLKNVLDIYIYIYIYIYIRVVKLQNH
jgi:hypothetical protein